MPQLNDLLVARIQSELGQMVKLSDKSLPSIAQIDVYNTYQLLTAVTLSDSGNCMVCGFQDSSIKVFVFDPDQLDIVTAADVDAKLRKPVVNAQAGVISFRESRAERQSKRN